MKVKQKHLLEKIRFDYNLSQSALGKMLGVSQMHISRIERGERPMNETAT
ncbi:helix-turn-helix domain-containing protein [Bacillus sp. KH172YL63]